MAKQLTAEIKFSNSVCILLSLTLFIFNLLK